MPRSLCRCSLGRIWSDAIRSPAGATNNPVLVDWPAVAAAGGDPYSDGADVFVVEDAKNALKCSAPAKGSVVLFTNGHTDAWWSFRTQTSLPADHPYIN
eukprot:tig00020629_g12352.t1